MKLLQRVRSMAVWALLGASISMSSLEAIAAQQNTPDELLRAYVANYQQGQPVLATPREDLVPGVRKLMKKAGLDRRTQDDYLLQRYGIDVRPVTLYNQHGMRGHLYTDLSKSQYVASLKQFTRNFRGGQRIQRFNRKFVDIDQYKQELRNMGKTSYQVMALRQSTKYGMHISPTTVRRLLQER